MKHGRVLPREEPGVVVLAVDSCSVGCEDWVRGARREERPGLGGWVEEFGCFVAKSAVPGAADCEDGVIGEGDLGVVAAGKGEVGAWGPGVGVGAVGR